MTRGYVTTTRKPMLTLTILERNDNGHAIQFIVDTGFTGQVLLPERYIRRLGLIMDSWFEGRPATGEVTNILAGEAIIIWQGQRRDVQYSSWTPSRCWAWNYSGIIALPLTPLLMAQ